MAEKSFKVSFTLDEEDANYFRDLYRKAKAAARDCDPNEVVSSARALVARVRGAPKTPRFVVEAIETLEDLAQLIEDKDYAVPRSVSDQVIAALAYFANPDDLIPDHIPGLGFLDDAIMVKFIGEEFKHELAGYRKFRKFRDGAEQRPWTRVAQERLPKQLADYRKRVRAEVAKRKAAESEKRKRGGYFGW